MCYYSKLYLKRTLSCNSPRDIASRDTLMSLVVEVSTRILVIILTKNYKDLLQIREGIVNVKSFSLK